VEREARREEAVRESQLAPLSFEEAAQILGVSVVRVNELVRFGVLGRKGEGVLRADVSRHRRFLEEDKACPLNEIWESLRGEELYFGGR